MRNKGVEKAAVTPLLQDVWQGKEGDMGCPERNVGWQDFLKELARGWRRLGRLEQLQGCQRMDSSNGCGSKGDDLSGPFQI